MKVLEDSTGQPSSMRIATMLIVVVFMGVWAAVSIKTNTMAPINAESVALLVGALGAKTWQKAVETNGVPK